MAFAGVYELWRDASAPAGHPASWLWTAAIITARATDDLGWLHDRMPMVIDPGQWADWLDPGHRDPDVLREAMVPAVSGDLHTRPVSAAVSSVANDGPGLIATVAPLAGELGEDPAAVMAPAAGLAAAGPRADGTLF
jgi:putative SOS response-associated peptidase YedK